MPMWMFWLAATSPAFTGWSLHSSTSAQTPLLATTWNCAQCTTLLSTSGMSCWQRGNCHLMPSLEIWQPKTASWEWSFLAEMQKGTEWWGFCLPRLETGCEGFMFWQVMHVTKSSISLWKELDKYKWRGIASILYWRLHWFVLWDFKFTMEKEVSTLFYITLTVASFIWCYQ